MTTAYDLLVNGDVQTDIAEWDATWEERVDGVGQASVTVQNRSNTPSINYGRQRDEIAMVANGFPLFHGEITSADLDLPAGRPFQRVKISASDFNTVMDLRLVGAASGYDWHTIDGGATHTPYDPEAHGLHSDRTTVQHVFQNYVRLPAGFTGGFDPDLPPFVGKVFEISSFVFNYIPRRLLYEIATNTSHLLWTNTTVRSALNELAGLAPFPIFLWIDPTDHVHWEAFRDPFIAPGGLTTMGPHHQLRRAPAVITDQDGDKNGTTIIGGRALKMTYDATYMPEQAYVTGVTDFIYNAGTTRFQGTGWRNRGTPDIQKRQILVDAQAITEAQRDAVAKHYEKFGRRARIKGTVTVSGRPDENVDGWRCGQYLTVYDERLPDLLNGRAWPILAVKGKLSSGNDFRVYTLEFGDAPIERFSQKYKAAPQRLKTARLPAKEHRIYFPTHHLRPSTTYTLYSQMVDHSRKPVRQGGVAVDWTLQVRDGAGVAASAGSLTAIMTRTDEHGRTAATLTTGAGTDLHYHVTCTTAATT